MNYYYHLTQPEFITAIQREGLKPMLGQNQSETKKKDFVCVPKAALMLGQSCLGQIR